MAVYRRPARSRVTLALLVVTSVALITVDYRGAGSGAMPPMEVIRRTYDHLLARAAKGELRVETEQVPLREIENAWDRVVPSGRRLVVVP